MSVVQTRVSIGSAPAGTKDITQNGTYDISKYAEVNVEVPTEVPDYYLTLSNVNGILRHNVNVPLINLDGITELGPYILYSAYAGSTTNFGALDLSGIKNVGEHSLEQTFEGAQGITSVNMNGLEGFTGTYGCNRTFRSCHNLKSATFLSLRTIPSYNAIMSEMFAYSGLESLDMRNLVTVNSYHCCGRMCEGCSKFNSLNLDRLTVMSSGQVSFYWAFSGTALTTAKLPSLRDMYYNGIWGMFAGATQLKHLYLPALRLFPEMGLRDVVSGVTGCTIHFPKNAESAVQTCYDYPNFGGTNTILVYDQPSVLTLNCADGNSYTRNPLHDTSGALAWRIGNDTEPAYYTSGTGDPQIGSIIYSDASCTSVLTTVNTIA